jgi:hypothetical protein
MVMYGDDFNVLHDTMISSGFFLRYVMMSEHNLCRLTNLNMKNVVFWDVAPSRSGVNRSFGGTYRLHLQGRKIRKRGSNVSRWLQPRYIPPKRRFSQALDGATSQNIAFFIVAAVKISGLATSIWIALTSQQNLLLNVVSFVYGIT